MILFTVRAIKLLLLLVLAFTGWKQFRGRMSKATTASLGVLILLSAVLANVISGFVPAVRDQITLTAQGKGCTNAKSTEVYLEGYTIDGETFLGGESLVIKEGHWFWSGERYAWRPETDIRQPEGITRTVVLKIPVGWNRTLNFAGHPWRGVVEIDSGTKTWNVDTYSKDDSTISVEIGRSETAALILNQARRLTAYAVLLVLFFAAITKVVGVYLHSPPQFALWRKGTTEKLICLGIAVITFALMLCYADRTSLWNDEMFQVAFSNGSLSEALHYCLTTREASPPLFDLFATFWYRIAPYGEKWLLLPSVVAAAFSVFFAGLIGEKVYGEYGGILSSIFCAYIPALWNNVAFEFRMYPFFVLFSFLTFYSYIRRNEHLCCKSIVAFGLSMAALAMSQYFGMIACACLFCSDVYLLWRKKTDKRVISSYFIPGALSLIWLIAVYRVATKYTGTKAAISWYGIPNIQSVKDLFLYLVGGHTLTYILLLLGIALALVCFLEKRENAFEWGTYYWEYAAINLLTLIFGLFIYGNITTSKTTLWTNRYFLFLLPHICVILTGAVYFLLLKNEQIPKRLKRAVCLAAAMGLAFNCLITVRNTTAEPWRESADWLYTQTNYIFNEDTVILNLIGDECTEGWIDYYVTQKGRRDKLDIESTWGLSSAELRSLIQRKNRVYVAYPHGSVSAWIETMLTEEGYKLSEKNQQVKVNTYVRK